MAADSPAPNDPDQPQQVEALIDELILEILDNADQGQTAKGGGRGRSPLAGNLLGEVRAGMSGGGSSMPRGGSAIERMLLAEALAGVLADALAPALAEALAPRIMKALEGPEGDEEPPPAPSKPAAARSHARKSESK